MYRLYIITYDDDNIYMLHQKNTIIHQPYCKPVSKPTDAFENEPIKVLELDV